MLSTYCVILVIKLDMKSMVINYKSIIWKKICQKTFLNVAVHLHEHSCGMNRTVVALCCHNKEVGQYPNLQTWDHVLSRGSAARWQKRGGALRSHTRGQWQRLSRSSILSAPKAGPLGRSLQKALWSWNGGGEMCKGYWCYQVRPLAPAHAWKDITLA